MDIKDFLLKLKEDFPEKAVDVSESLELLKEILNDTIETIGKNMSKAVSARDFEKTTIYSELAQRASKYESDIDEMINVLDIEELDINLQENEDEEIDKKVIPNYSDYLVDNNVEHTLYENFTHKRPFGFKINDKNLIEVKSWQEMLVKTCELLIAIDEDKFMSFKQKKSMNGKKNKYFSTNPEDLRKGRLVSDKIYVEINQSGNSIRNLITKMLKEYGFKISDYKVYFRADYTNINN
ncbi:MAG: hypothetical protein FH758_10285 [Firmicutes bacterium]|nr:hypothetical protein [Bacillota bacterium]